MVSGYLPNERKAKKKQARPASVLLRTNLESRTKAAFTMTDESLLRRCKPAPTDAKPLAMAAAHGDAVRHQASLRSANRNWAAQHIHRWLVYMHDFVVQNAM